ncbi:MAG: hypothetical protein R3F62_23320 [Planctomycetota bacterium]
MNCPTCGAHTRVYSTYAWQDGVRVTRYRLCPARGCWLKFKTLEEPLPSEAYALPPRPTPRLRVRRRRA